MTTDQAINQIKFLLGKINGLKTSIELNDEDIQTLLQLSIRELVERVDTPSVLFLQYQPVINVEKYKIAKIDAVLRTDTPYGTTEGLSYDPFYLSNSVAIGQQGVGGNGGLDSVLQMQAQYAIRAMAQNVVQAELVYFHDLYHNTLTVSYSGQRPHGITLLYRPVIQTIEDLPSPIWETFLIRLATAHGKVIIGRIRSKYAVAGSPVTINTDILAEGTTELEKLYEELKAFTGRWVV